MLHQMFLWLPLPRPWRGPVQCQGIAGLQAEVRQARTWFKEFLKWGIKLP